ncbi:MAG: hypothetical protein M1821_007392 [Bathelium mastoideum]|nr:MAG: hypothetical protein M1821_007392 [Bathelium mastoideum]
MTSQSPSQSKNLPSTLDETTPLLATSGTTPILPANGEVVVNGNGSASAPPEQNGDRVHHAKDDDKPLPFLQILLLCYARIVEPCAYFCIFPFVNQMIEDTGDIDKKDVGFYSGLIESLFSLTQMSVMLLWGRAADRIGRKPVLCSSLFGVSITMGIFGLSQTIWQMILFRCLAGIFAGTVLTVRTMITENSTPKNQARAFSFFAFAGNLGIFVGPLIGGGLARPAKEYPAVFGGIPFFEQYPYALPTFATSIISLSAAIVCTFFVKETLAAKKDPQAKTEPPMSTWEILKSPGVGIVLYLYAHISLQGLAYTAIIPVVLFEPIQLGGFSFSPRLISIYLAVSGISQALWLLLVFPLLQRRFGTGRVFKGSLAFWPVFFLVPPLFNQFARRGETLSFWITGLATLSFGSGIIMVVIATQLTLNNVAPSARTLGTLNSLALALGSGIRAIAPASFSSLCAAGIKYQILGGQLIWLALIILALACVVGSTFLPARAEGEITKKDDDDVVEPA